MNDALNDRCRHRRRRLTVAVVALAALVVTTSCEQSSSGELPPSDEAPKPGAETYAAAISRVLDVPDEPPTEPPDPLPIVYVVPISESLSIEQQASVIDSFEASHDIRFVEKIAAAVEADTPGRPPRDDAVVLAVGTVTPEPPHLLRIEQYLSVTNIDATLLTLAFVADEWVVVTAEQVPAEALTDAD